MPTNPYTVTTTPSEYTALPVSAQPDSDIQVQYNIPVQFMKEILALINGGSAGTGSDGTVLKNYIGTGIVDRLEDIETSGKVKNSTVLQLGSALAAAGDRAVRFIQGGVSVYKQLLYNQAVGVFQLNDNAGTLQRIQIATPTVASDAATKNYVDSAFAGSTLLARYFESGLPTRTGNDTLTMSFVRCRDNGNVFNIATSTTVTYSKLIIGYTGSTSTGGLIGSSTSAGMIGTISVTSGSATVTGVGTSFLSSTTGFQQGDTITTSGGNARIVDNVSNDTSLTVTSNFSATESTVTYNRNITIVSPSCRQNLYVVSDGVSICLMSSPRSVVNGDTLVDLPLVVRTGTVSVTSGSKNIIGSGTAFTTQFGVGHVVKINGEFHTIESITSDILMTASVAFSATAGGQSIYIAVYYYRQIPFTVPIRNTGNLADWSVSGWPHSACVMYRDYDGTSDFTLQATSNTTSALSIDVTSKKGSVLVPRIASRFSGVVFASKTGGSVPSNLGVSSGISSSVMFTSAVLQEFTTTGPTFNYITPAIFLDLELSSAGLYFYKVADTNVSIATNVRGYHVTGWY